MIPVSEPNLYVEALECLKAHRRSIGRDFKGRFIQIFFGLKFFQNNLPSMYSGSFVTTEVLQSLLDDLYSKASRAANDCVLSLFEGNYLARTGLVGVGNSGAQNTWRNNLNLQKGIGCYAPSADLSSLTFLNEDRINCKYLRTHSKGKLKLARCSLCLTGAEYRGEGHRKWLRIDPGGNGYAVVDLQNTANFAPYVAPQGKRIPILPLIVALYHDADVGIALGARSQAGVREFMTDFNLSETEFAAYFDEALTNPLNARLMQSTAWPKETALMGLGARMRRESRVLPEKVPQRRKAFIDTPDLSGTATPPPAANSGWEAEQYVLSAMAANGWTAYDVSRQQLGYDLFAQRGKEKRYVEVKSSLGSCSPSLTAREWQQASFHAERYVLAIIENFKPSDLNTVYWVPDPVKRCVATPRQTISHDIPRGSWQLAAVPVTVV